MNRLNLVVAMSTAVSAGLAGCPQDDSDSGVEGSLGVDEQTEDFARHGDEAVGALNLAGGLETLATGCTELLGRVAAPRTATDALSAEEPDRAQTSFETSADDAVTPAGQSESLPRRVGSGQQGQICGGIRPGHVSQRSFRGCSSGVDDCSQSRQAPHPHSCKAGCRAWRDSTDASQRVLNADRVCLRTGAVCSS
jgi:hypothetical protein